MRGDGLNAWRSLPDAFRNDREREENTGAHDEDLPYTQMTSRPGSHCWHNMSYPGRAYRLKLRSCNFLRAHVPLLVDSDVNTLISLSTEQLQTLQTFPTTTCFLLWESSVDIRANVDYLTELNDLIHYNARRRARNEVEQEANSL